MRTLFKILAYTSAGLVGLMLLYFALVYSDVYVWGKGDDEIYLVPEGFTGYIAIWPNRPEGKAVRFEKDARVYDVPSDGILATQFDTNEGWHRKSFYYETREGKRVPIEMALPNGEGAKDSTVAIWHYVTVNAEWTTYNRFFVGSRTQVDTTRLNTQQKLQQELAARDL